MFAQGPHTSKPVLATLPCKRTCRQPKLAASRLCAECDRSWSPSLLQFLAHASAGQWGLQGFRISPLEPKVRYIGLIDCMAPQQHPPHHTCRLRPGQLPEPSKKCIVSDSVMKTLTATPNLKLQGSYVHLQGPGSEFSIRASQPLTPHVRVQYTEDTGWQDAKIFRPELPAADSGGIVQLRLA